MNKQPCPKCGKDMENLGNVDNIVFASNPPQWDITFVCHSCKVKKRVRIRGRDHVYPIDLSEYENV